MCCSTDVVAFDHASVAFGNRRLWYDANFTLKPGQFTDDRFGLPTVTDIKLSIQFVYLVARKTLTWMKR